MKSRFLTLDDQRLIGEKARLERFAAGQVILPEGTPNPGLLVLRSGRALVKKEHLGYLAPVGSIGPGEVVGEMSFIEGGRASATVVADGAVEVDWIEPADLHALLESVPGFAARFWRSIAQTLARRLRETNEHMMPPSSWG